MSVPTVLTLLVLCMVKVQCVQESPSCPRKESHPGVLALKLGSEVILGCRGDVTVDGVLLVMGTKHKERLEKRGDVTNRWRPQKAKESPATVKKHHLDPENVTTTGKYKINTVTGKYDQVSESVTSDNPVINTKEQIRSKQVLQAVNQFTKFTSSVTQEGGAFSVTMEMGMSTERIPDTEDEENEEYEEKMEGLRVTRSIKRSAQWTRNGQLIRDGVEHGGVFRFPALRLTDSGNYSCYRRGKLVSSIKISVGIPPVGPTLSCHKKSHISKIRCEWISRQPIIPQPQCYLLHRRGLEKISLVNCSYSDECSCCWCAVSSRENDRNVYTAELCVTNTAGHATSSPYSYIPQNIIKPDPPHRVEVKPVNGEPHMLIVSWSLPATWRWEMYYTLCFQLRYRPLRAKEYQLVDTESRDWLISDALPHIDHEIQIRAKDEYEGQWSDWTSPVYAHTWTDFETTVVPDFNTQKPVWIFPEGSGGSDDKADSDSDSDVLYWHECNIRPADDGEGVLWLYVLWVVGFFLFISIIILSVFAVRWRMPFIPKTGKESVSSTSSCSSPSPFIQQPLITVKSSYQEKEGEGIHLHNVDYFRLPCGPATS